MVEKLAISIILTSALLLSACGAKEDPAEREKALKASIERLKSMMENYKANEYEGIEQLEYMKSELENQLRELQAEQAGG
jgi:hypothetical protein